MATIQLVAFVFSILFISRVVNKNISNATDTLSRCC